MAALRRALARRAPLLVAVGVVLVLATDAFLVHGATVAHPVSPAEALTRYRLAPSTVVPGGPRPGVYLYETTGFARVSTLGTHRRYPTISARIVRAYGCGWREEVPLFDEHVETYDHCGAEQVGFGTRLTYFTRTAVTDLACVAGRCVDAAHGVEADLTVTREGGGVALVGGVEVPCRRVTVTTVLRGSNVGGAVRRLCVDPRTRLVLSEERSVGVTARSAFVGRVDYTESATFVLRSLEPLA